MAASVDIEEWQTTPRQPMRCSSPSSPSFACLCATGLGAVVWLAVAGLHEPAVLLAMYGIAMLAMHRCLRADSAPAHVGLAFLSAAFAASCGHAALPAWVGFIASVLHVMQAMLIMELDRLGDCQRCLQDATRCECGRGKLPLPAGTLHDSAAVIQACWRDHRDDSSAYVPRSPK